ncbi:MAG TPA: acetate/propionate family kinase [Candidatus Paceibacterota bacterium]|nr:acetate/propionate family kinase [Candidatus Paceibacterota bacterium]HMP18900.1 acetate/propionate family kinase [Candidatus Paceibacterota bacterium]HMP85061.1 acetate/propionate family kinase [Candidatus Paceibacterota bacterium]
MKKTIIVNNGSTSKKYAFYNDREYLFFCHYEETPDGFIVNEKFKEVSKEQKIDKETFHSSFSNFIDKLLEYQLIDSEDDINAIAIRIVAPGIYFQDHKIIDEEYLLKLDDVYNLSPLHLKPVKDELFNIKERLGDIKIVGISDSAFHKNLPEVAKIYAFPKEIVKKNQLYRYGYHGISVNSVYDKFVQKYGNTSKIIICHLGGGSSVTAIKDGKSIETSMGFSPLEGMPMASRVGSADPNALIAVMESEDFDTKELQEFLYKECGVKAISGISADTRVLIEEAQKGNHDANLALDFFAYNLQKNIGAYYAVLGGLDALIFTGTIGERSAEMRRRILEKLEVFGLKVDHSKNKITINGEGLIQDTNSVTKIAILKTAEIEKMAEIAFDIV